jgi:hypothetical protein
LTVDEYIVWCSNCGAFGPNDLSPALAIKMWNLRRPEDAQAAEIARLRGIIAEARALALAGHEPGEEAEHTWRMLIASALAEVQDESDLDADKS